jgi:hypothetical protein
MASCYKRATLPSRNTTIARSSIADQAQEQHLEDAREWESYCAPSTTLEIPSNSTTTPLRSRTKRNCSWIGAEKKGGEFGVGDFQAETAIGTPVICQYEHDGLCKRHGKLGHSISSGRTALPSPEYSMRRPVTPAWTRALLDAGVSPTRVTVFLFATPVKLEDVDLPAENGLVDWWMDMRPGEEVSASASRTFSVIRRGMFTLYILQLNQDSFDCVRRNASMSSTSLTASGVNMYGPSSSTQTLSSIRMPMPRAHAGHRSSSGT